MFLFKNSGKMRQRLIAYIKCFISKLDREALTALNLFALVSQITGSRTLGYTHTRDSYLINNRLSNELHAPLTAYVMYSLS